MNEVYIIIIIIIIITIAMSYDVKQSLQIYIRFYGANCGIASNSQFDQSLDAWLSFARRILRRDGSAPLIFIGVPAMERASPVQGCYRSTRDLRELYKVCKDSSVVGILSMSRL